MKVNNIDQVREEILRFSEDKTHVHTIMILQRGKDGKPNRNLKQYHINCIEDYDKISASIPDYCESHEARAYISINPKDIVDVGFNIISKTAGLMKSKQYDALYDIFNKAMGESKTVGEKRWLVDIDTKNVSIVKTIYDICVVFSSEIYSFLETKNGFHIITKGFNPNEFKKVLDSHLTLDKGMCEILKDQPNTLLYV